MFSFSGSDDTFENGTTRLFTDAVDVSTVDNVTSRENSKISVPLVLTVVGLWILAHIFRSSPNERQVNGNGASKSIGS
jgi:hypothetical protein